MEDSNEEKLSKTALVDRISEQIHAKILSGEYKLGEPLRQQALAAEFGVSRTPIRRPCASWRPRS
jgi:DNA-binding GntR family transcriptional regulator